MVCSDSDPNWLHFEIVNTSISTANSLIAKGIDEAKNLIDNAVQKMFEFEKSGLVIEADVKFRVLFQKAKLFFFYEGEAAKYYNALLELESLDLPTSEANIADLQMQIAVVEYDKGNSSELTFKRLMKALEIARPWG